jgi:hypothetical protein
MAIAVLVGRQQADLHQGIQVFAVEVDAETPHPALSTLAIALVPQRIESGAGGVSHVWRALTSSATHVER